MARYCRSCGRDIKEHLGKGAARVCPIQPDPDQKPILMVKGETRRFVFDPGQTRQKTEEKAKNEAEQIELKARRIAEAELELGRLESSG